MAAPEQVNISISTSSEAMQLGPLPAPQPPTITINDVPVPTPTGELVSPNGMQVVVLDVTQDLTKASSIITNIYQQVFEESGFWSGSLPLMYNAIANQMLASGNPETQVVILASFGLDIAMVPTPEVIEQLLARGAGKGIQQWPLVSQPSEGGLYIEYPANYCFIGVSGWGYGEAFEAFDYATEDEQPVNTTLNGTVINTPPPS